MASLDPANALLGATAGLALSGVIFLAQRVHRRWVTRRLRSFWRPFMGKKLTVVVTEYPSDGEDPAIAKIARVAGGRWLISKGMALALAEIRDFANRCLSVPGGISIRGDRSGIIESDNYVVFGSEASNNAAIAAMRLVRENFTVPYTVRWNSARELVEIAFEDGQVLQPTTDSEHDVGEDYALILKATIRGTPSKTIVLASGCHMWGTQAAAEALTSDAILHEVAKQADGEDNVAFIIRTQVLNGAAQSPELAFGGTTYVVPLQPRRGA